MKVCGVEGSNPSRVNGSSVDRVHNIMVRPVKSAVRIRLKQYFYPNFGQIPHFCEAQRIAKQGKRECAKSVCGLKAGDTADRKEEQHPVNDIEKR